MDDMSLAELRAIHSVPSDDPDLVVVDLADFLAKELPPRKNLLTPWLPCQGLAMIYAARGIGKTHLSLGITYAVSSGGHFLGWEAPEPAGVLFVDGEMPATVLQERLAHIAASENREPSAPLRIMTPDLQPYGMPDLASEAGQAAINRYVTDDISLIVVDNLSTLARGIKGNEGDSWLPIQSWALMHRAKGRSVLFIHHAGKGGNQRGTSRREDVLDTVIALRRPADYRPEDGAVFEVHFEKARGIHGQDVTPFEARLIEAPNGYRTWATRTLEESTFDRVVALLNDGLSQRDVCTELNITKSTVSYHARKAREQGLLRGGQKDG